MKCIDSVHLSCVQAVDTGLDRSILCLLPPLSPEKVTSQSGHVIHSCLIYQGCQQLQTCYHCRHVLTGRCNIWQAFSPALKHVQQALDAVPLGFGACSLIASLHLTCHFTKCEQYDLVAQIYQQHLWIWKCSLSAVTTCVIECQWSRSL